MLICSTVAADVVSKFFESVPEEDFVPEEEGLLDGLPPAVDSKRAFHDPVYPMQNHTGADTGWQPSVSSQGSEGNYRR